MLWATKLKTPNLDRLAKEGLRFTDEHSAASMCTPTRFSLLTGDYCWRHDVRGLNRGVAAGDDPLLIKPSTVTLPSILKRAGYRTGVVGKWHLGFGETAPDYNAELKPGPLEVGFDEFFGYPATNDRVPPVYVRDHRVVGLDPADPITVTYKRPGGAVTRGSVIAGVERIGWMTGGKAAVWKDDEVGGVLLANALAFVERHQKEPFFLYFAPHAVHPPTVPSEKFRGKSGLSPRADMLCELDAGVGQILDALDRLKLAGNTLLIFTSDNGAFVQDEKGHRPNGPWHGEKEQYFEGGHRVPFLVRWPGHVKPGVSDALIGLTDLPATAAAIVSQKLPATAAPDSVSLLPLFLGETPGSPHEAIVVMSSKGALALRKGPWKYMSKAVGLPVKGKKKEAFLAEPGLYNLVEDPGEQNNLAKQNPEMVKQLAALLEAIRSGKK